MRPRLIALILAFVGIVALIFWTAQSATRRSNELREKLTSVHLKSFQIADHFQQTILELNNAVLRYGVYHDPNDWAYFEKTSKGLDAWIDDQVPLLSTEKEKQILELINSTYDQYTAAARQIASTMGAKSQTTPQLQEFSQFEDESQRVLNLGFKLAGAHGESMNNFLADSNKSLSYLRVVLVVSLGLLLVAAGGLAVVVYGELIAPLRVKLVQSQAIVERQEKLASLGMLAAGLAHEIRNPLTAIKAWLFIQKKHLHPHTTEYADAEIIANEVSHLERIVKDVLLFARPSEPRLVTVSAEQPLRQAQALLATQFQEANIRIAVENSARADIRIDPQQIQQVLINLIQNAAESISRDGVITLRASNGSKRMPNGLMDAVVLEVADNGRGIAPDVEKRLFDPFFTTKEAGTGLGLSIAARIVEKHGGALQYTTQVNRGTTFGIVLPRVKDGVNENE